MSDAATKYEIGPAEPHFASHFEDVEQKKEADLLGMWAFIGQEIMFFGGLFTAYAVYRFKYPDLWQLGADQLNQWMGVPNTVFLLISSLTMASTVYFTQKGRWKPQIWCFVATMAFGTAFLVVKYFEYKEKWEHGLVPGLNWNPHIDALTGMENAHAFQLYFIFYFIMTGMHALHMIIGVGIGAVIFANILRKKYGPNRYMPIEIFGYYWHFVDIVWVFLFPMFYLI